MNTVRSSRRLEAECKRNIVLIWLMENLSPDHNTISNFRRDNPNAINKVFKATVSIAKHFNLIGGILVAGDSTKLRAQNSKKKNYNQKKLDQHFKYINQKLKEYNDALAESDEDNKKKELSHDERKRIRKEIDKQKQRKAHYKNIEEELNNSGQSQVSTSDPDSRHL